MHSVNKKIGWALYDVGSSAYFLVFSLYLFPVYVSRLPFFQSASFELFWGIAQGLAVTLAVAGGLVFGKKLDRCGMKTVAPRGIVVAAISTFLLPLCIGIGVSAPILLLCYAVVQAAHLLSLTIYDASLPHVAADGRERAVVSGWAWGLGYLGGLACMAIMEAGLYFYPRFSVWDFAVGSVFYIVAAISAARWLGRTLMHADTVAVPERQPLENQKIPTWMLLISIMLIVDGIAVFMSYTSLYGVRIVHLSERQMTHMLALLQFLAFPMTALVSYVFRANLARGILLCGFGWVLTAILLVSSSDVRSMIITIIVVSIVVGSMQSLLRTLYSVLIPRREAIQAFGKYAVVEKGAAFIGPVLAGVLIPALGYKVILVASGFAIAFGALLVWLLVVSARQKRDGMCSRP